MIETIASAIELLLLPLIKALNCCAAFRMKNSPTGTKTDSVLLLKVV